jgi:hypothetical protein
MARAADEVKLATVLGEERERRCVGADDRERMTEHHVDHLRRGERRGKRARDRAQPLRTFLRAPALGYVASDHRGAEQLVVLGADGRDRERDVHPSPVLADALGLEVVDLLPGDDPAKDQLLLAGSLLGDDHADRPADRLVGRVAVQPRGCLVPARDDALERLAKDRVVRGGDECLEVTRRRDGGATRSVRSPVRRVRALLVARASKA